MQIQKKNEYNIVLNDFGYYEVRPSPSKEELAKFYREKYFQEDTVNYQSEYDEEEISYIKSSLARKYNFLKKKADLSPETKPKVLEIGVGEGWALQFLHDQGFDVLGVDFSNFASKRHNPEIQDKVEVNDPDTAVENFIQDGKKFDLIWLDNVLEHSPTPEQLLKNLSQIANDNAYIFIEVPNDYSMIQKELQDRKMIQSNYWEAPPEHLSYFNLAALKKLCTSCDWSFVSGIADFPIDIFLLNKASNYNLDPSVGKNAHRARMIFELMLDQQDFDEVLEFYEAMLNIGLGREIAAVFVKEAKTDEKD